MDGDMNDIFQKFNSILEDKDMSDNLKNILNNFSSSNTSTENSSNNQSCSEKTNTKENSNTNSFNFDINTILKIKSIMDSLNNEADDPRANLLLSLKPYLANSKKDKVDKYIKFLQLTKVLEAIGPIGGDNTKNE